jgi:hypothetical protein
MVFTLGEAVFAFREIVFTFREIELGVGKVESALKKIICGSGEIESRVPLIKQTSALQ